MSAPAVQSGRRGRGEADGPVRFVLTGADVRGGQLVLRGTWSGVRGLRFVRPTLVLGDRDVLATLEHKPWAVEAGTEWVAAFPWTDQEPPPIASAQLAVAPNITVALGDDTPAADAAAAMDAKTARLEREVDFLRGRRTEELGAARKRIGAVEDARDALRERLASTEARVAELDSRAAELTAAHRDAERRATAAQGRLAGLEAADARAAAAEHRAQTEERTGHELRARVERAEQRSAAAERRLQQLGAAMEQARAGRTDTNAERERLTAELADARSAARAAEDRAAAAERRVRELEAEVARAVDAERRAAAAEDLASELATKLQVAERRAGALAGRLEDSEQAAAAPAVVARGDRRDADEKPLGVRPVRPRTPRPVHKELLPGLDLWVQRILASAAALSLVLLLVGIVRLI